MSRPDMAGAASTDDVPSVSGHIITTKYGVGDVVYHAGTTTEAKQHPCPDCNNTRKWSAVSPAGNDYSFACPRCSVSYASLDKLSLRYTAYVPSVALRTIGSVQYNSAPNGWDTGTRYMCAETGVGGGTVYSEADLFASFDEAMEAATEKAAIANNTHAPTLERFNRTLEVSDYQLENGALKSAQEQISLAGQLLWNINDLFDQIKEAGDKDAILEAVDDYQSYSRERDLEKLFELVDTKRAALARANGDA